MANRTDGVGQSSPPLDNERPTRSRWPHSPLRLSVAAGFLVAAVILGVGALVLVRQGVNWSATASVVVLPARDLDPETQAGYYETLSRGQVVATFAEMLRLRRFETAAGDALRLPPGQRKQVEVTVEVVPDTAVITVTARAADPTLAEEVVDHIVGAWVPEVYDLATPYAPTIVSWANGTARRLGTEPLQLGLALVFVALVAGLAVQQGTLQAALLLRRRREEDEVEPPEPAPPTEPTRPGELDELEAALFERWWKPGLFGSTPGEARRSAESAGHRPGVGDDEPSQSDDTTPPNSLEAAPDVRTG